MITEKIQAKHGKNFMEIDDILEVDIEQGHEIAT